MTRPAFLRTGAVLLVGALSVGIFFRYQVANGFTLLLGDRHDGLIALSILEHWHNVLRETAAWDRTGYFFPVAATLGYNDGYLLFGLAHAAFRAGGADPFLAGELANVAIRAVGFLAMHAAARRVLRLPFGLALLAAALFTLSNNLFIRASHVQLFSVCFTPLLAWLLHGALRGLLEGRRGALLAWGGAFALAFAACLMTGFYMAWYCCFLGGATLLAWLALAGRPERSALFAAARRQALPLAGLAALLALLNLPFLLLYLPKAAETGMHPYAEVAPLIPSPLDILHVGEGNLVWGWLVAWMNATLRPGFPAWSERMTGLPPILLVLFGLSLAWLWRGRDRPAPPQGTVLRALGIATLLTWAVTLQVGGVSAWSLAYQVLPGARAARSVGRYQIFLAGPVIGLAMVWLAARAPRLPVPLLGLLAGLLLLEQLNTRPPLYLDRPHEMARLRAVPPPPAACRAFFVSAARTESRFGEAVDTFYNHNTDAMLVAAVVGLPTVNGISSFNPPHWRPLSPGQPGYGPAIEAWAAAYGVTGLCALDLQRMEWRGP